jgi:hydroxypyruvate reductase
VIGEARVSALAHVRAVVASAQDRSRPLCIVSSGETTVNVTGHGKGGRNQEFALASAELLSHLGAPAALASVGTDGIDGPTDAAGAIVDSTTTERARTAGLMPDRFLADNNAYAFFNAMGDLIHTGPTGTNVGDLQVILLG